MNPQDRIASLERLLSESRAECERLREEHRKDGEAMKEARKWFSDYTKAVTELQAANFDLREKLAREEGRREVAETEIVTLKKMVERSKAGEYVMEAVLAKQDAKDAEEAKDIAINVSNAFDAARLDTIRGLRAKLTSAEATLEKAREEVAALKQAVEAARGLNILHDEEVRRLQAEVAALKVTLARANDLVETHENTVEERDQARAELAKHEEAGCWLEAWQKAEKDLEAERTNGTRMREALKVYARRADKGEVWNWTPIVRNSHSGRCWDFDWEGDEQEMPWDIAERALLPDPGWLKRHDAEVRAEAFEEAAKMRCAACAKTEPTRGSDNVWRHPDGYNCRAWELRERAAEERREGGDD